MKCLIELKNNKKITQGSILIYSDSKAYLIINDSDSYFLATQIFNNDNEELGTVDYSCEHLEDLIEKLNKEFGTPQKIVSIYDVSISLN